MSIKGLIGLAVFAVLSYFSFLAVSGIWGIASSAIWPEQVQAGEEKIFVSTITINSIAPESVLSFGEDAKPEEAAPQISERRKRILALEDRVQIYSSLFDSASLIEMDEYEAGSVN